MKGCTTCKHLGHHTDEPPCAECLPAEPDFPLWEVSDQVKELIAEAEKRAFEAGREVGISHWILDMDTTAEEDYNNWKEANP